jgi:hypothetical protein
MAGSLIVGTADVAAAQQSGQDSQVPRDCVLRKEPNGMIRGGSQPQGCVLVQGVEVTGQQAPTTAAVACEERIVYTPNARKVVLTNCARLSGGRLVIPTVPPSEEAAEERHFGPLQRHFGAIQNSFGPLQHNFGSDAKPKSGSKGP